MPEKPSWALQNGIAVHSIAENYLKKEIQGLPPKLSKFKKEFDNLVKYGAIPEEQIVFDNTWTEIPGDSWMDSNAWLRMKIDARVDNMVIDFKTGKHYDDHVNQARLYANAQMMREPSIDEVDVEFWYLNSGEVKDYNFVRTDLDRHIEEWNTKVEIMHNDTEFKPTKNLYCKYCDFIKICPAYK